MVSRVWAAAPAAAALVLALSGCSSDDDPGSSPSTDGAGATVSSSGTPEASASATSSTDGAASLPAGEQRVETEILTYTLPGKGWYLGRGDNSASRLADDLVWDFTASRLPGLRGASLDELADLGTAPAMAQRADDRTVGGSEGYVIEGENGRQLYYEFGTIIGDWGVTVEFEGRGDPELTRAWIEFVLASIEWK
jgi:hypothetical protein